MNIKVSKEKMGEIFRLRRKDSGLRQQDVAEQAGVSISTVSNLELGNHTVKEESIVACAEVLGVAEDIFGLVSEAEKKEQWAKRELEKIEKIIHANPSEALNQLTQLNDVYNIEANKTLLPLADYLWGKSYFEKRKWQQAEKFLQEAVKLIEEQLEQNTELRDSNLLAASYNDLANISYFQNDLKQALRFVEIGLQAVRLDGKRLYHRYFLLLNRCLYLQKQNDKEKAMEALEELQLNVTEAEKTGTMFHHVRLAVIIQYYDTYANVLSELGMMEKAVEFAQKGIDIAWLNQEYDKLLTLWTTMGMIFLKRGNLHTAKEYFLQALHIKTQVNKEILLAQAFTHLGQLHLQQNEPIVAKKHIKEALVISEKYDNVLRQVEAYQALGHCYFSQQQFDEAVSQLKIGYELASKHDLFDQELELIDDLCACYKTLGKEDNFLKCTAIAYDIRQNLKEQRKKEG